MKLSFTKMHGCGNNYIYINCFDQKVTDPEKLSIALSEPHFGIGGDLTIRYTTETVFMTGAAATVFKGEIEL